MNAMTLRYAPVLLICMLLIGCTATPTEPATPSVPSGQPVATPQTVTPTGKQLTALPTRQSGSVKPLPITEEPIIEAVPEQVMAAVLDALEERLGARPADYELIRSQAVTWNDGSLGCPEPGMFYTQATVAGYWIVVQVGDSIYDYRLGNPESTPVLCTMD